MVKKKEKKTPSDILKEQLIDLVNIQVRTYIDSEFEIDNDYVPLLGQYLKFQFDDETIEFIYFMIGHLMTKLNDKFDFMVFLFGKGGSVWII
ncbi:hypothetical protein F444_22998 [Phytophthora nicotianae P1976]|uniref:Uncharacterized protein n=1 Tax=Phytophthora nicotianae P1976 TaxID=1317066 RepID=A0A080YW60_PHYNI|nr:hypothetical protein F444_22998 [Phytophthora nicotianae P1976]